MFRAIVGVQIKWRDKWSLWYGAHVNGENLRCHDNKRRMSKAIYKNRDDRDKTSRFYAFSKSDALYNARPRHTQVNRTIQ